VIEAIGIVLAALFVLAAFFAETSG